MVAVPLEVTFTPLPIEPFAVIAPPEMAAVLPDWTITPLPTEPFAVIVPPEMIAVPELTFTPLP